jgi:hypothetical protein
MSLRRERNLFKRGPRLKFYLMFDENYAGHCKCCYTKSISLQHDCIIFSVNGQHTKIGANRVFLEAVYNNRYLSLK